MNKWSKEWIFDKISTTVVSLTLTTLTILTTEKKCCVRVF